MAIWVLLLALATYAGGLGTGWPLLQHVAYALWLVILCGLLTALASRRGLSASLSIERLHVTAGEPLQETVTVRKRGVFPAFWLSVVDPDQGRRSFLGLRGDEERHWHRERVFSYRGRYTVGGDEIRAHDPFGLFSFFACRVEQADVTVYPRPIAIDQTRALAKFVHHRSRPWSEAAEASIGDLRRYTPGDPPSRIHWRSTARTGTLLVADPEPRARQAVWLAVDLGGGDEAADRTAGIAAHLCSVLAPSGVRVGAVVAGEEVTRVSPRLGPGTESAVLEALARVRASDESELGQVARAFAQIEAAEAIIVVSPFQSSSTEVGRLRRLAGSLAFVCSAAEITP